MSGVDLVVGGAGFIGSQVVRQLRAMGREVVVYDNFTLHHTEQAAEIDAVVIKGDVRDHDKLRSAFYRLHPERVFNFASCTDLDLSEEQPIADMEVTVGGTCMLLELAKRHGVKRFVFTSTSGVYGGFPEMPIPTPESFLAIQPTNTYQANKRAAEIHVEVARRVYGLSSVIYRFAQIYGPGKNSVITRFLAGVLDQTPVKVHLDGSTTCDMVFVEDAARAVILGADSDFNGTLNVGSGREISLNDLLAAVEKVVGRKAASIVSWDFNDKQKRLQLDPSEAHAKIGFAAQITVEEGIERTYAWLRQARETGKTQIFRPGYAT